MERKKRAKTTAKKEKDGQTDTLNRTNAQWHVMQLNRISRFDRVLSF